MHQYLDTNGVDCPPFSFSVLGHFWFTVEKNRKFEALDLGLFAIGGDSDSALSKKWQIITILLIVVSSILAPLYR